MVINQWLLRVIYQPVANGYGSPVVGDPAVEDLRNKEKTLNAAQAALRQSGRENTAAEDQSLPCSGTDRTLSWLVRDL